MICNLRTLKNLRALHALEDLEPLFEFPIHLSEVHGKLQTNIWKIQSKPLEKFSTGTPPNLGQSFAL